MFIVLNNTMYITMGITMFLSPLRQACAHVHTYVHEEASIYPSSS
jgi:hypothetical protein